ncbi:sugar isomerase [Clostridium intestinale]|uniref:sugar isomerase n=1 Tax=Clostridium intestinale TaxID=36845 RepID=UPI0028EF89F7|nr:sugar isomerase [Clostridium intestinale]
MRSKIALINSISSFALQFITIICGLILPRLIINTFGSSLNGTISSITQFLSYIALLEAGVGGVVRAALYKPLEEKNIIKVSKIIKATDKFFKTIAFTFAIYLIIIALIFPSLVSSELDNIFTFSLVIIIGLSTFSQYYFGITYQQLLQADQKRYITSIIQIAIIILNTIFSVVLIKLGANILIVKFISSLIYILKPITLNIYVKKKYKIIKNSIPDNKAIEQRWDGFGHHIATFIHRHSDVVILTIFLNIKEVSVYSIYLMIILGVENITTTISSGVEAAFGNMIAKGEKKILSRNFELYEFVSFIIITILFSSTALTILPFVSLYTKGVTDVNYYRPEFAYILILAESIHCVRLPYNYLVFASGHFKQTRNGAFLEAIINILISVILVKYLGIIGVAIGTLCAITFRTFQYANYLSKNILVRNIQLFLKRCFVNVICVCIIFLFSKFIPNIMITNYITWLIYLVSVVIISTVSTLIINMLFYKSDFKDTFNIVKRISKNK